MADLTKIYKTLSSKPLQGEELDRWYVETVAGRGNDPVKSLKRRLFAEPDGHLQILFSGYRGCGKSTELNKMGRDIAEQFLVLNYSVYELDPVTVNYVELFILTMEKLFALSQEHHLGISKEFLESVNAWRQSAEIENVRELAGTAGAETGAEVEASVPFMAKFFAKLRAEARYSTISKKTIFQTLEPRLSDLINHCNDLIREVKSNLPQTGRKGLLIVIEDLDKLILERAEELFFNHSPILTTLHSNVIFTFPISLIHHTKAKIIIDNFDPVFELPMIKVHDKEGAPFEGRETLRSMVECRIGTECFESEELLYRLIDLSGGCLRDLFRLIREAADNALNHDREMISETDCKTSFYHVRRDYENSIAEKRGAEKQIIVSVEEYYETLKSIALSETKKVDNTEAALDLRQNLCILSYNDEGWSDVHPIVRSILEERKMIP
ncbi:MAG: hypothetical protein HGB06_05210 [Chlorobaculum sp.]|nr:hypothetical protein [Chlorobaculum sp.]